MERLTNRARIWLTEDNFTVGNTTDSGKRTLAGWLGLLHDYSESERELWEHVSSMVGEASGLDPEEYEDLDDMTEEAGLDPKVLCNIYHKSMDLLYGIAVVCEDGARDEHAVQADSGRRDNSNALCSEAQCGEGGVACNVCPGNERQE